MRFGFLIWGFIFGKWRVKYHTGMGKWPYQYQWDDMQEAWQDYFEKCLKHHKATCYYESKLRRSNCEILHVPLNKCRIIYCQIHLEHHLTDLPLQSLQETPKPPLSAVFNCSAQVFTRVLQTCLHYDVGYFSPSRWPTGDQTCPWNM